VVQLDQRASGHIQRVLRMRAGDALILFNGEGGEYHGTLTEISKRHCLVECHTHHSVDAESPLDIGLIQGICRGERMDMVMQKATELGVHSIHPIQCDHSVTRLNAERSDKKLQHWRGIVISACEQSGRNSLPPVHRPQSLEDHINSHQHRALLLLDPTATNQLSDLKQPEQGIDLLIGPEGGFSEHELTQAYDLGCTGLQLGPRILRTETAGLAAIAVLQTRWGDLS